MNNNINKSIASLKAKRDESRHGKRMREREKRYIHLTCCVLHSHCHNGHEDIQKVNNDKKMKTLKLHKKQGVVTFDVNSKMKIVIQTEV